MNTEVRRRIESFSLHVGRNFGILSVVALAVSTQAQTLASRADRSGFAVSYGVVGTVLAAILQIVSLVYVFDREALNRPASEPWYSGSRWLAALVSVVALSWHVLFVGLYYGIEL